MKYILFILLILLPMVFLAQNKCATIAPEGFNQVIKSTVKNRNENNTIYVVFHVLYRDSISNISDEQIESQLEVLNQDFNGLNKNRASILEVFKAVESNVGLRFCLADTDVNGMPQVGIIRRQVELENFGERIGSGGRRRAKHDGLGGSDAWDPSRYLNVWICENSVFGEATFPDQGRPDEQGILIDYRAFGGVEAEYKNANTQDGHVLSHEIGHFLGLQHVWGNELNNCEVDDGIGDTPSQANPNFNCPETAQSCGSVDMFQNFMDFTDDDCVAFFTEGQRERIWDVISQFRPAILQADCLTSLENGAATIRIYPTLVEDFVQIERGADIATIRVYDCLGSLVVEQSGYTEQLDFASFRTGIYIIRIQLVGGKHEVVKVLKK